MTRRLVVIVANNQVAHMPSVGQKRSGLWLIIDPVLTVPMNVEELTRAIEARLSLEHPRLDDSAMPPKTWRDDPLLRATNSRSWKQMAAKWFNYTISWSDRSIEVTMSRLDGRGRWEFDPSKTLQLPLDTPIEKIVSRIIDDVCSRPNFSNPISVV